MLACKSFTQNAAKLLKNTRSTSEAVNYVVKAAFSSNNFTSQNDKSDKNEVCSQNTKVDYAHILESPPNNQKELYQSDNSDKKTYDRIEELKKNRESFGKLTLPIMTSLFSDRKMSKNAKDLYNSFTEEIIKEQKKLNSGKSDTSHAEVVTNRRSDNTETDLNR